MRRTVLDLVYSNTNIIHVLFPKKTKQKERAAGQAQTNRNHGLVGGGFVMEGRSWVIKAILQDEENKISKKKKKGNQSQENHRHRFVRTQDGFQCGGRTRTSRPLPPLTFLGTSWQSLSWTEAWCPQPCCLLRPGAARPPCRSPLCRWAPPVGAGSGAVRRPGCGPFLSWGKGIKKQLSF